MRWHPLDRRRRSATPRRPDERYVRADRLTASDMPELSRMWRSLR